MESEPTEIDIVRDDNPVRVSHLAELAGRIAGQLVKAVVDVADRSMAIGGLMHADEEAVLLDLGSRQRDLWGINLYPDQHGTADFIEFDSMINLRPGQGNRSRAVDDPALRAEIEAIVDTLVV